MLGCDAYFGIAFAVGFNIAVNIADKSISLIVIRIGYGDLLKDAAGLRTPDI